MKTFWLIVIGTIACLATVNGTSQTTSTSPVEISVIGCLHWSDEGAGGTHRESTGERHLVIDDVRAGSYRVNGDVSVLGVNVSGMVELAGTVEHPDESTPEALSQLTVESVIPLSRNRSWE